MTNDSRSLQVLAARKVGGAGLTNMYEQHFNMASRPFGAAPNVTRYFPAAAIDDARQRIAFCIERGDGPAVVIGSPGTGKTMLLEVLAETFRERFDVVLPTGAPICTRRALLQVILHSLGMPYENLGEGELRLTLIDRLQCEENEKEGLLLLIDEAQSLPLKLLEELRMLTNLFKEGKPCAQLVLAGPSLLEERLGGPSLELLQQRIAVRCLLEPMDCIETRQYVQSQITAAGGAADTLFDDEAVDAVFRSTDGVPRLVNQLCDHGLLLAAIAEEDHVSSEAVEEAWRDLQQMPAPTPNEITSTVGDASVIEFGSLDDFEVDESEDIVVIEAPAEETPEPECSEMTTEEGSIEDDSVEIVAVEGSVADENAIEDEPSPILDDVESKIETIGRTLSSGEWSHEPTHHPFGMPFVDEEVVEDRFASIAAAANAADAANTAAATNAEVTSELLLTEFAPNEESPASTAAAQEADDDEPPSTEPLERFEPTPLVVQPDANRWDADPVFPETTQSEDLSSSLPQLEVVGASDVEEELAEEPSATAVAVEKEVASTVATAGSRFGQLFASLRRE